MLLQLVFPWVLWHCYCGAFGESKSGGVGYFIRIDDVCMMCEVVACVVAYVDETGARPSKGDRCLRNRHHRRDMLPVLNSSLEIKGGEAGPGEQAGIRPGPRRPRRSVFARGR